MAFKYRKRTAESVSRRAKQSSGVYDSYVSIDAQWFKPKEGENIIRIMPWISQDNPLLKKPEFVDKWGDHWGIDIFIHRNVGPDNGTYLCANKMSGEPCPICDARNEAGEEEAQALKPQNRILCWLIDRSDEKAGPKLWNMPLGTSKDISARSTVKGTGELLSIDDPEEGYDIYFDREGVKDRTKYEHVDVARDPSPLHDKQSTQDRWLDYVEDNLLPEILEFHEANYLEKILFGQMERAERSEVEGDRERPARRGRRDEAEPEREEKTSRGRRGRDEAEAPPEEPERERRGSRRAEREEPEPEGEPEERQRGSRRTRGRSDEAEPERDREAESDNEGREARSSRGSRRGGRDEAEPERDEASRGGQTERYRSRQAEEEAPPPEEEEGGGEKTAAAAKGRLGRLGRRGRG